MDSDEETDLSEGIAIPTDSLNCAFPRNAKAPIAAP